MASLHDASFFCIPEEDLPEKGSMNYRNMYCVISLFTASLGLFGSSYQLFAWNGKLKDKNRRRSNRPATNPVIIFNLALANLLSCIGVMLRSVAILVTSSPKVEFRKMNSTGPTTWDELIALQNECTLIITPRGGQAIFIWGSIVEAFTQFSYAASVIWTFLYSVDTYAQLYGFHPSSKIYHCASWLLAALLAICSQLVVTVELTPPYVCANGTRLVIRYLFAYIPMLVVLILNPIFLWSTQRQAKRSMFGHSVTFTDTERQLLSKLRQKFVSIVFLFTLCWLPNQVDSILQLTMGSECKRSSNFHVLFPIWIIEAVFNPLQGLLNCFIFGRRPSCLRRTGDPIRVINPGSSYSERQTLL